MSMYLKKHYNKAGKKIINKINRTDIIRYKMLSDEIKPNSVVLDIGSREAEIKNFIPKNCSYVATDISRPRVERLKK